MNFDNTDIITRKFTRKSTEIAINTKAGNSKSLDLLESAKSVEIFTDLNWNKGQTMTRSGDSWTAAVPFEATECKFVVNEKVSLIYIYIVYYIDLF